MEVPPPLQLRITTWNALNPFYENEEYYTKEAHPYLHWDEGRRERALAYLKPLDSDVYCLQEVRPDVAHLLHHALGKETYTLVWHARTPDGDSEPDGCATLYRTSRLVLAEKIIWRYKSRRHIFMACLFACDADRVPLWIVNTHVNYMTREQDLAALQRKLTRGKKFVTGSKVIVGDFNARRSEDWYQLLGENGIIDTMSEHQRNQWSYSYKSGHDAKWIDYILLHRLPPDSVVRVFVDIEFPRFNDTALPNERVPSDHMPLTAVIRLRV